MWQKQIDIPSQCWCFITRWCFIRKWHHDDIINQSCQKTRINWPTTSISPAKFSSFTTHISIYHLSSLIYKTFRIILDTLNSCSLKCKPENMTRMNFHWNPFWQQQTSRWWGNNVMITLWCHHEVTSSWMAIWSRNIIRGKEYHFAIATHTQKQNKKASTF